MTQETTPTESPSPVTPAAGRPTLLARVRGALHGPLLIGVVAAAIAIGLSLYGMIVNHAAPLTLNSIVLVILIAGGSWGLIAWAIATAAVEAGQDE
ncbi:MAG: hypothetical protein WCF84_07435 [Anaerolineae bacterium]